MNATRILSLVALVSVAAAGCAHIDPPRPMSLSCSAPKTRVLERAAAVLTAKGYKITMVSADIGILNAERDEFSSADGGWKFTWSLQTDGRTLTANARQIHGPRELTFDRSNFHEARGDGAWFSAVMDELDGICAMASNQGERSE